MTPWTRSSQGPADRPTTSHTETHLRTVQGSKFSSGRFWSVGGVCEENIPDRKASEVDLVTLCIERAGLVCVSVVVFLSATPVCTNTEVCHGSAFSKLSQSHLTVNRVSFLEAILSSPEHDTVQMG